MHLVDLMVIDSDDKWIENRIKLDNQLILKLSYYDPLTRRIYTMLEENGTPVTRELFIPGARRFHNEPCWTNEQSEK